MINVQHILFAKNYKVKVIIFRSMKWSSHNGNLTPMNWWVLLLVCELLPSI